MSSEYDLMRLAETQDEDAVERDEIEPSASTFASDYTEFYNDLKLSHSTKEDW